MCVSIAGIGFGASERAAITTYITAVLCDLARCAQLSFDCWRPRTEQMFEEQTAKAIRARSATLISITRSKTLCNVQNVQVKSGLGDPQNEYMAILRYPLKIKARFPARIPHQSILLLFCRRKIYANQENNQRNKGSLYAVFWESGSGYIAAAIKIFLNFN
jgi:hypothetical protein